MKSDRERSTRDHGVTLIELLVGVVLMGLLTVALCGGLVVILRQSDNTTGRLNNSRSEQAVGTYLPTDLASASKVNIDANASPCGTTCPATANMGGSSALFLSWDTVVDIGAGPVTTYTTVSYRYVQVGTEWQLVRVECNRNGTVGAYSCNTRAIVHNLDAPPAGVTWTPGTTVPSWVIQVSIPLDPADPGNTGTTLAVDPNAKLKGAQRVTVTINGGGDASGAGGGINQISLSAGGTTRATIPANSTIGVPSFTAARSRCGGNIVLVVDKSGSIDTGMGNVRTAVTGFINAFAGTPVKLQVIAFSSESFVLGSSNWTNYTDMLNASAVTALRNAVTPTTLDASGGTNYEDAFYRVFKNENGTNAQIVPDLVVFFTDGVPTVNRTYGSSYRSGSNTVLYGTDASKYPPPQDTTLPAPNGSDFSQISFNRTNTLIQDYRNSLQTRMIGVGVGPAIDQAGPPDVSDFITASTGYHFTGYERGYRTVNGNRSYTAPYTGWESGYSKSQYDNNNTTYDDSDGWRGSGKTFTPPYDYGVQVTNQTMLTKLITGIDTPIFLNPDGLNIRQANMYFNANFSELPATLSKIALGECGGTLTLQTQQGASPASDGFTYVNTAIRNSAGGSQSGSGTSVTTTLSSKSGTFDFAFPTGQYVDVDIMPSDLDTLSLYTPAGWTCTAGPNSRSITPIPITGRSWTGFTVRVYANESVSCVQKVTRS